MPDTSDGSAETGLAHFLLDAVTVHDDPAGALNDAAQHRHSVVVRASFERRDISLRVGQSLSAAIVFDLPQIPAPIIAADSEVGDQVVQIGFMQYHHAGMVESHLVRSDVIRIVPDLVNADIVARGIEVRRRFRERLDIGEAAKRFEERCRVVGDAALCGRQGRSESYPHQLADQLHRKRG